MRSRELSREKVLQIRGQRPRICNVFEIHFSWPQYPGKIQNYTRTNYSNSERSGQLCLLCGKIIFPARKNIFPTRTNFFPTWKNIFSNFSRCNTSKGQ